ncbi:CU044_5270 family protein [Umezawaea sp. Da 62-37]|uniref:CU044_5270 family protein n=1 Tax=Umezawaea sp. Da 62-37 TaxID=3075927 RepID=UPI0028F6D0DA|nr:CU044_5270 family protein [Umezawaea sp. Da 62-37]WNV89647.1 CU044_5270 family protein [Umezawaea sp. Da 62-37]
MDDLTFVRELGDETPLPNRADLAPARDRLLAGMTEPAPVRLLRRRSRFALVGGTAVGLAAAVAAVITLAPVGDLTTGDTTAVAQGTPTAIQVLRLAAERTLSQPEVVPRPDQYVYTLTEGDWGKEEFWQAVDGTRDAFQIMPDQTRVVWDCNGGHSELKEGGYDISVPVPGVPEPDCNRHIGYRTDLPTNADDMLAYLNRQTGELPDDDTIVTNVGVTIRGAAVGGLMSHSLLPAATRAALFEAASRLPGLTVVPNAVDGSGRPGVGITWPMPELKGTLPPGMTLEGPKEPVVLVFDANTYEYLGTNTSAVVKMSIVDHTDQRP